MAKDFFILSEKGYEKYDTKKLQGAGITALIYENGPPMNRLLQDASIKHLVNVASTRPIKITCYVNGSDTFMRRVEEIFKENGLRWQIRSCKSEDEIMAAKHITFLDEASVSEKRVGDSKIEKMLDEIKDCELSDDAAIGILMAAEEISGTRIFPPTEENIYHAFVKAAENYIPDKEMARTAVDRYLAHLGRQT